MISILSTLVFSIIFYKVGYNQGKEDAAYEYRRAKKREKVKK